MSSVINKFGTIVKGTLSGFDRIVFKGYLLPLMYEAGVNAFLRSNKILNKEYKPWMMEQTHQLLSDADSYCQQQLGCGISPIKSSKVRKEELARERQEDLGTKEGLIGIYSAVEACSSYKARFSKTQSFPRIQKEWTKCKHLYFYFDHCDYGFMSVRLQTWFPYHIQIAINGREWLRRDLEKCGIGFERHKNKFLDIDNYAKAQRLLDAQLDVRWIDLLDNFLPTVFPAMQKNLGPDYSYYWTLWQSEWAQDHIFSSPRALTSIGEMLIHHAFMTGTSSRILRYFDRPLTKAGLPFASMNKDITSRLMEFGDGIRVRHWVGGNSVKVYTEQNVLRTETTMNEPGNFRVWRRAQGASEESAKRLMPMRKSVADIPIRAEISQQINNRMNDTLAELNSDKRVTEVFVPLCKKRTRKGRSVRGLDPMGKDRELLRAICDPAFEVSGITNRAIREKLAASAGYAGKTQKQQSAKTSRLIRLLRDHSILCKFPKQNKYRLSVKGREITTMLNAILYASSKELIKTAA